MKKGDIIYNVNPIEYYKYAGSGIIEPGQPLIVVKVIENMIVCERFSKMFVLHKDDIKLTKDE